MLKITRNERAALKTLMKLGGLANAIKTLEITNASRIPVTSRTLRALESKGLVILADKYHFNKPFDAVTGEPIPYNQVSTYPGNIIWVQAVSYSWRLTNIGLSYAS